MGKVNRAKVIASAHKYLAKGNLKKAVREYERVLKDDPSDIRTKLKVADLLFRLGEKDRATATFEEVAKFYAGQGFLLKAVAVFKQVQKLKPDDVEVHLALAALYQQIGLVSDAINQYREAIALQERSGQALERLKTAQKMLELDPDNAKLRVSLAEDFSREGMIEEAVHEFRAAYEALKRQGLEDEAVLTAERLLYHQPDDWETSKALSAYYIKGKDGLKALARLQVCFRARPNDPETLDLLAQVFEFLGQPQKAATVLKALARQYDRTGLIRDRDEVFQRVLKLNPGDRSAAEALRFAPPVAVPPGQELEFEGTPQKVEEILVPDDEEIGIDELLEDTSPEEAGPGKAAAAKGATPPPTPRATPKPPAATPRSGAATPPPLPTPRPGALPPLAAPAVASRPTPSAGLPVVPPANRAATPARTRGKKAAEEGSEPIDMGEFGERTLVQPMLEIPAEGTAAEEVSAPIDISEFGERTLVQNLPSFVHESSAPIPLDLTVVPPEFQDDLQNLEFLVDAGLTADAMDLMEDIRRRGGDLPILAQYEALLQAGGSPADPESDANHRG